MLWNTRRNVSIKCFTMNPHKYAHARVWIHVMEAASLGSCPAGNHALLRMYVCMRTATPRAQILLDPWLGVQLCRGGDFFFCFFFFYAGGETREKRGKGTEPCPTHPYLTLTLSLIIIYCPVEFQYNQQWSRPRRTRYGQMQCQFS